MKARNLNKILRGNPYIDKETATLAFTGTLGGFSFSNTSVNCHSFCDKNQISQNVTKSVTELGGGEN